MPNPITQTDPATRLRVVTERIRSAAQCCQRDPACIKLLAVSKTQPAEAVTSMAGIGQTCFGENYVHEAQHKIGQCDPDHQFEWHFIGAVQSNKTATIARTFDWVHSIDRLKIARRLSAQRPAGLPALNLCLQVNISGETSKAGVPQSAVLQLAEQVRDLPGVRLRGLMGLPAPVSGFQAQLHALQPLRTLYDQLQAHDFALDTLSMGMSADLEAAIALGSTLVRIGTALFGPRYTAATASDRG